MRLMMTVLLLSATQLGCPIKHHLAALVAKDSEQAHIGIQITSLKSGKTVYAQNANHSFTPASSLKIVTAASALHHLGPGFRFETKFGVDEFDMAKGIAKNLYVVAGGDPTLTDKDLAKIADDLKQLGIRRISGDIVIDASYFDDVPYGRGWMWDDLAKGFSAPISAASLNQNRLVAYVKPGLAQNQGARVWLDPATEFVKLAGSIQTASDATDYAILSDGEALKAGATIHLSGRISPPRVFDYRTFAVNDPVEFFGHVFAEKLRASKIAFVGKIRSASQPEQLQVLLGHHSQQLSEMLIDFVKVSNNHGMECLLKTIGRTTTGQPGSFKDGLAATNTFLQQEVGVKNFVVADGSGGSRYSLMTPAQMVKLLQYGWNNFFIGPELVASLPIGGEDGTLYSQFRGDNIRGKIRAKTGTMTGVSTLAGYVYGKNDETFAFAIMMNGAPSGGGKFAQLKERILETVLN